MKRTILVFILTFIICEAFSQTSSGVWNSRTATYSNAEHKITWQLMDNTEWIGRPILEESTLFKVRNDELQVLVQLGATKSAPPDDDIWNYVSMFESEDITNPKKQLAAYYGMEYIGTKAIKSQLCGIHAVKVRTDMKKDYPEYNGTIHSIETTFSLYHNGYIYTITVTALSVLEEGIATFDRITTMIFNGFKIK